MDTTYTPTPNPVQSKVSPAKLMMFGATLFVALVAVVAAVVLPGMKTTDDRSKANVAGTCSGQINAVAAICNEKCLTDQDCTTDLRCLSVLTGTASATRCRREGNPSSATCVAPVATPIPTRPPVGGLPTAPPGCVYKQVQCIKAPCDPILECSSPTATPIVTKPPVGGLPTAPPGCVYKQVQCIKAPCDPVLECSSPTPTPTPPAGCTYQEVVCIQAPCNPILVCPSPRPAAKTVKIVKDGTTGWIDVDAINEDGGLTQQTSTRFTYTGSWATDTSAVYNGGSSAYTGTPGATVTFATTATSLKLMTTRAFNRASFDVYVNGVKKATLSTINSTRQDQYVLDLSAYLQ